MLYLRCVRVMRLALLLIKEQLKEPVALCWMLASPSLCFYLLAYSKKDETYFEHTYVMVTSWFYAYLSATVAFFGFCFYIIGRRESGFIRSFIYTRDSKRIFLAAQFVACSVTSMLYCLSFYVFTRLPFGQYDLVEFGMLLIQFYVCFVMFCTVALLLTLCPLNFQNANTALSIFLFGTLALGMAGTFISHPVIATLNRGNPMVLASDLLLAGFQAGAIANIAILSIFTLVFGLTLKYFRINPLWSRY